MGEEADVVAQEDNHLLPLMTHLLKESKI